MNKSDLIAYVASTTELSKAKAEAAVNATFDAITNQVVAGGSVTIHGFGTFEATKRAARTGTNPSTGAPIEIAARTAPKFKPGKAFKDALN